MNSMEFHCDFRYHTDKEIKKTFAELEQKYMTTANFEANENEVSMAFPSLKVTSDVSNPIISTYELCKIFM